MTGRTADGTQESTGVLVVGAGLTGLSAAVFLAGHGVPVVLVERNDGVVAHPRARNVNLRVIEILRQVGLEAELRSAASHISHLGVWSLVAAETLAGPEKRSAPMSAPVPVDFDDVSPSRWFPVDQDRLERVLLRRAVELGADVRYGVALTAFEQDPAGVTAELASGGAVRTLRADHLVAADGFDGPVRRLLGTPSHGDGQTMYATSFVFRADLTEALRGRRIGMSRLDRPQPGTMLMPYDEDDRWCLVTGYTPAEAGADDAPAITLDRCADLARAAVGLPDLPVEVEAVLPGGPPTLRYWLGASVVDRFSTGRVFLAGDAAHLMPPSGAFGASTGVQDVHNLAWKIAAVRRGEAGPALLETYDAERRPVAELSCEHAGARTRQRNTAGTATTDTAEYGAVMFGYSYAGGPPVPPADLAAAPGTRAPHLPVVRDGREVSTLDLFGRGFVLLTADAGWAAAARESAAPAVEAVLTGGGDRWSALHGGHGAVLVRPDGFVAWRTEEGPERAAALLRAALDGALHRTAVAAAAAA